MLGLRLMPLLKLGTGFRLLWSGRSSSQEEKQEGEISSFQALMTALSATVGTGNIAGVATAVFLGGPGALFWMWCTALVGMATKFSEAVLAVLEANFGIPLWVTGVVLMVLVGAVLLGGRLAYWSGSGCAGTFHGRCLSGFWRFLWVLFSVWISFGWWPTH